MNVKGKSYGDKLLDPRWQQKKSAIQIRDGFTCKKCGKKDETLHVHHRHYLFNREPWDYPEELLVLLCSTCHKEEEQYSDIGQNMFEALHYYGYFNSEIKDFINNLIDAKIKKNGQ